jgi:hypothetical protein
MSKSKLAKLIVKDPPKSRWTRAWCKRVYCPLFGHDPLIKMDGTLLCRRH